MLYAVEARHLYQAGDSLPKRCNARVTIVRPCSWLGMRTKIRQLSFALLVTEVRPAAGSTLLQLTVGKTQFHADHTDLKGVRNTERSVPRNFAAESE